MNNWDLNEIFLALNLKNNFNKNLKIKKPLLVTDKGLAETDIVKNTLADLEKNGFSVVRDLVGHGIGKNLHEEPQVPNYGPPKQGHEIKEGMCLAIEPMINLGNKEVKTDDDGWTIRTLDGTFSAHFEHTIAVTADGPLVLSKAKA